MDLQKQIAQQQSTVSMLEKMHLVKRCSQQELDTAKRRLDELQQQVNFKPVIKPEVERPAPMAETPIVNGPQIDENECVRMQAEWSVQIDQLNRKMAELSNQLHKVPPGVSCANLTKPILDYKEQIESLWDKKRYLERNRALPAEPEQSPINELPTLEENGRMAIAYTKRTLIDQRSKLKRKLLNPKAKASNLVKWETELAKCNLKIQELDVKLS